MKQLKYIVVSIILMVPFYAISQVSLSQWKNYSLGQNFSTKISENSFKPLKVQSLIDLNSVDFIFNQDLEWINRTIGSVSYVNSNRTVLGNRLLEPVFSSWGLYKDYYSLDSFEYQDLDVQETKR